VLVRLIDVVLILLFGFISISTIERRSPVRLPDSESSVPLPAARGDVASVTVLHDPAAGTGDAPRRYFVSLARGRETAVAGAAALRAELVRLAERSATLQRLAGRDPVALRVDLRVDRQERVASRFAAHEGARDLGLATRIVVRAAGAETLIDAAEQTP